MRLGNTTVAIPGHGLVIRVADGRVLGQAHLPKGTPINKGRTEMGVADKDIYGRDGYSNGMGSGDIFLWSPRGLGIYAFRLRIDGDVLGREILRRTPRSG